jgi:hypothetical protein
MTTVNLPATTSPTFAAVSSWDGRAIELRFSGSADLSAREALEVLLPRLHSEAIRVAAAEVKVDFRDLEFMNSSCFRSFVSWVSDVQDLPEEQQYRISFRSNAAMLWQRRSLHALKCFANDLVQIEA